MPVTAALCPHPPLLLPQVTGPAADERLETLRGACHDAVVALLAPRPRTLVVVGPGTATTWHEPPGRAVARAGVLAGLGVPTALPAGAGPGAAVADGGAPRLPLSLAVGTWLLDEAGGHRRTGWLEVAADEPPARCHRLGADLAGSYDALLVLGDASSRRGPEPPGGSDPRAEGFDASVADALAAGDADALAALDPALAAQLGAGGRVAWQVLAGWAHRRTVRGRVTYDAAPFGVGYHVATWSTPARHP